MHDACLHVSCYACCKRAWGADDAGSCSQCTLEDWRRASKQSASITVVRFLCISLALHAQFCLPEAREQLAGWLQVNIVGSF